jgi:Domain of unknown function (DUF5916)/Carbohydrate family 9 binding domain-like
MTPSLGRIGRATLLVTLGLSAGAAAAQQASPPPEVHAVRTAKPPVIDGRLIDECWALASPASEFTQLDPDEGKPATEQTEVRFVYDDDALYVGIRLFDREPQRVVRRLSTRDSDADADRVTLYLDPMHDRLTGAIFRVSAANVQKDAILYNDSWQDTSWDAVWQSQVASDDQGWTVEMRIPLSQLRFPRADHQTWGVNVERFIQRKNEYAWLEMVPKNQTGIASRMLNLAGFDGLSPTRHLELLPYTAARQEFITPAAGSPFNDGARAFGAAGLDLKWGVTSNLTVNATANPDFGQVEVDPAVVNLTAFETFFPEKRAFFLEGAQILNNFGQGGSNNFWGFNRSEPQIFYSRRIGRAPQIKPTADFIDAPTATTILGATKLTGKTSGGWSIGFLEAVTNREEARTRTGVATSNTVVEPVTNYSVTRIQREFGRRLGLGFVTTAVNRKLDTPDLQSALTSGAYVVGTDAYVFLDSKRDWVLTGRVAGSRVEGSADVVTKLQTAAQRYYQRPDAPHVHQDPLRTSLSGVNGSINLNRNSGTWQLNAALWSVSPGFESNDLGFQNISDRAGMHVVSFWRGNKPNRVSRSRFLWIAKWYNWNFNRELQGDGYNAQTGITFRNYWFLNLNGGTQRKTFDDRLTRGGPSATNPGGTFWNINGGTDQRKWIWFNGYGNHNRNPAGGWGNNGGLTVNLKPSPRLTLSTGPQWSRFRQIAQYVTTITDATATPTYGSRYLFGTLDQTQLSMTTRVTAVLSPTVSVQVFMQPLLAAGDYTHLKELARPRTFDFLDYAAAGLPISRDPASRVYTVDPDGESGSAPTFTFDDPNFNLRSLRLNAVFRWEMKPGSTLYGVWTRQQQDSANPGPFALGHDARAMFAAPGDDVFLVKIAYWIGR